MSAAPHLISETTLYSKSSIEISQINTSFKKFALLYLNMGTFYLIVFMTPPFLYCGTVLGGANEACAPAANIRGAQI